MVLVSVDFLGWITIITTTRIVVQEEEEGWVAVVMLVAAHVESIIEKEDFPVRTVAIIAITVEGTVLVSPRRVLPIASATAAVRGTAGEPELAASVASPRTMGGRAIWTKSNTR